MVARIDALQAVIVRSAEVANAQHAEVRAPREQQRQLRAKLAQLAEARAAQVTAPVRPELLRISEWTQHHPRPPLPVPQRRRAYKRTSAKRGSPPRLPRAEPRSHLPSLGLRVNLRV